MTDCCTKGVLHAHATPGSSAEVTLGGQPAYIAHPAAPTDKAVVIVSDVFGFKLPNARLVADLFASEGGFICVLPDVLEGDALPLDAFNSGFTPELAKWFEAHGDAEAICGQIGKVIEDLKASHGVKKVALQGYCWGARFAILACGTSLSGGAALADAFGVAHPTRVAVPKDIEALTTPGIFLCAEKDSAFTPENVESAKAATAVLTSKLGLAYEFRHYPGTEHGFAVRGGDDTLEARNSARQAAAAFFHRVL